MVKNKVTFSLLILFLLTPLLISDTIYAAEQRIYDDANILTDEEITKLEQQATEYYKEWDTDFIIITINGTDGVDIKKYMQDFTDELAEQFNRDNHNMAVLAIDMEKRDFYLAGFDFAQTHLDDERLNQINQQITPDLSDGNYYAAFQLFFEKANEYLDFRPGVNPESLFFNVLFQIIVGVGLAAIIVFAMAFRTGGRVTTTNATYLNKENTELLRKRDKYVRKSVTRRKKPSNNNKGGGGGFRGGGGISGGGRSHSGSRGSF